MTSSTKADDLATVILASCRQTRFHIEAPVYQELDIHDLNITVTTGASSLAGAKPKGKARSEGLEILTGATLKLKPGIHYGLIGRNGSGKSTILRAISEKLIPGIPLGTRISALQQNEPTSKQSEEPTVREGSVGRSVLDEVIERAVQKTQIQQEIDILSEAIDKDVDPFAPLRAIRSVRHRRLQKQLFELDKDARLRSGARGWDARKALIAFEKTVADSEAFMEQEDNVIDESTRQAETEAAISLHADLQSQIDPSRLSEVDAQARSILTGLGFPKSMFSKPVSTLSGGWNMRCQLASALLQTSDILILDEATNYLDLLGIIWLERHLLGLRETSDTTVIVVSHDRDFVDAVCQEVIVLRDRTLAYFRGNLSAHEHDARAQKLYLGRMKAVQERQKAHMERTISNSIRAGRASGDDNKLRQAKSRQKKVEDRMGLQVSARGGRFKLNRDRAGVYGLTSRAEIEVPTDERGVSMRLPRAPDLRFPGPLVSLEKVGLSFKSNKGVAVLKDVDLSVYMGDRVGLMGLNGSGKTSLIDLLTGRLPCSAGVVARHPRLRLGYYSQHAVEDLQRLGRREASLTALALMRREVSAGTGTGVDAGGEEAGEGEALDEADLRQLLGSMGLPGRTASDVPVARLSGGQLVRLALCMLLWRSPQLLVLDEITTHLDSHTVAALAEALARWNGAVVLASHDRFTVRRVIEGEASGAGGVGGEGEDEDEDERDDELDKVGERRRDVYVLKGGELRREDAGIAGFELSLEKQMAKLMAS